jgi:hypothetical protein
MNLGGIISGAIILIAFPSIWYVGAGLLLIGLVAKPDERADW